MYNYLYYADTVSISSIPLYHIAPNTKILINNAETGISGDYILNSISIPFAHDELANISASKSVDRLY